MRAVVTAGQLVGFKHHLRAEVQEGLGVFLFSERGVTALKGQQIESLAAMLDGTKDVATVLRAHPGGLDAEQVADVIDQLITAGLVVTRGTDTQDTDECALAYWDSCGVDPVEPNGSSSLVGVQAVGTGIDVDAITAALHAAGIGVERSGATGPVGGSDLTVVICDDYLAPGLAEVDVQHRAEGTPWLLAKPIGAQLWLGPFFEPGEPGCWHCLATRLWVNRRAEACAQAELGHSGPAQRPAAAIPALTGTAGNLVALEVTKWLAGLRHDGQRCVWTLDSVSLQSRHHRFTPLPQCAECGDPSIVAARALRPITLSPTPKASRRGGGHRSKTLEQVKAEYGHLVSPVTGVLKEITRDERVPGLFHSYNSGPNLAAGGAVGMRGLQRSLRDQSGGKGVTALDAEVGALCEGLERRSGVFHGDEARVMGSLSALADRAIHPNDCMLVADEQYATRAVWNAEHGPSQHVCAPFDEDEIVAWTPVWSLTRQCHRLLPTAMLYYDPPVELGGRTVIADSNGNAAGSSIEDAILQGMLELVERDAVALWWYNRTPVPGVDLASFGEPWLDELTATYASIGRELWVLDVTSDLDIPAMAAVSRRVDGPSEQIVFGFGAHLDARVALRRALTEMNQIMPAVMTEKADDATEPDLAAWLRDATTVDHPYLTPMVDRPGRSAGGYDCVAGDDIREDVSLITRRLAAIGIDTLVLDQTRPDIGLPVVKVIAPGLRHFWARFAPGRLYDVPVRLGRLAEPTGYDELNPVPMHM